MKPIVTPFDLRKLDPAAMPPGEWKIFISSDPVLGGLPFQARIYEGDVLVSSFGLAEDLENVRREDEALLRRINDWVAQRRARLAESGDAVDTFDMSIAAGSCAVDPVHVADE